MIKDNLQKALKSFLNSNFASANFYYSLVLEQEPDNKQALLAIAIIDIAQYSRYYALKLMKQYLRQQKLLMNNPEEYIYQKIDNYLLSRKQNIDEQAQDYIEYEDLLYILEQQNDEFKEIYTGLNMQVIIHNKDDLADFLEILIDNKLIKEAEEYIENFSDHMIGDKRFEHIFLKLQKLPYHK